MSMLFALAVAMTPSPIQNTQRRADDADFSVAANKREAERTMRLYADCVVARRGHRPQVDALLRTPPGTPGSHDMAMKLVVPNCMPRAIARTEMRVQESVLRPALYSALYRAEFGRAAADVGNRAPANYASEFDGGVMPPSDYVYIREIGDCTSRARPVEVRTLVLTRIATDEEKRALDALMPTIQQCVPAGATLRFSRTMLRGTLAEGLYKLSKAPVAPAPAGGAGQ